LLAVDIAHYSQDIFSQQKTNPVFKVVPLGCNGSAHEGNLSSYLLAVNNTHDYVCLDAGTLHDGIEKAIQKKSLPGMLQTVLKKDIKGYLISHPHLDHVSGFNY
jgi:3',5'-cyclic-nucleotide phosphodiesterase